MECSGLAEALAVWLGGPCGAPLASAVAAQERSAAVLLVGVTVREAAGALRGLAAAGLGARMRARLFCPLGTLARPYCFFRGVEKHEEENAAARDLNQLLAEHEELSDLTSSVSVVPGPRTLEAVPSGETDIIVFGPLAFGHLYDGKGAFDCQARQEVILQALALVRVETGLLFFFTRDACEWQSSVFGADFENLTEDMTALMRSVLLGEHMLPFRSVELSSHVLLPEFSSKNVHESLQFLRNLILTSTYGRRSPANAENLMEKITLFLQAPRSGAEGSSSDMKTEESASIVHDKSMLTERGTLFIVAWSQDPLQGVAPLMTGANDSKAASTKLGTDSKISAWWPNGHFHNVGLANWNSQREEWLKPRGEVKEQQIPPVPYEDIIAGLASMRRTFELPRPMRLSDLIDIYLDIWESQDGY